MFGNGLGTEEKEGLDIMISCEDDKELGGLAREQVCTAVAASTPKFQ
jgi:hypothetical protein